MPLKRTLGWAALLLLVASIGATAHPTQVELQPGPLQRLAASLDANGNAVLDDAEVQHAITLWVRGDPVAGTDLTIDDADIVALIGLWVRGETLDTAPPGAQEGEVGILFREGTECLGENAQPRTGDVLYVSPAGDDLNAGNAPEEALRTLASALCNVRPGQTVRVLPGTYRESVVLGLFGDASAPTTVQGVSQGGQRPVLDGDFRRTMGLALVESTHFVVENLEFRNFTDEGLYVLVGSDHVVRGNRFVGNGRASIEPDFDGEGFGVQLSDTRNIVVENNEVTDNGPGPERTTQGTLGTGIDTFALKGALIRGNHSYGNIGGGLLVEDGVDVVVENNVIDHNELDAAGDYWDGAIWVDGGRNVTLRQNTIVQNHGPGLQISDEDHQYPQASKGYLVEDNTITGNLFGLFIWNFGQCPFPKTEIARFSSNTIQNNTRMDVWCEKFIESDDSD